MAEDGEGEGRLGDEDVAGDGFERRAGRVRLALVVAADDGSAALVFQHHLGAAEDVAGGAEGDLDFR